MGTGPPNKKQRSKRSKSTVHNAENSPALDTTTPDDFIAFTETGEPLFTIDVAPTKVEPASVPTTEPQLNARKRRDARRRLESIERYRRRVRKELGIPLEAEETNPEVEKKVAAWTRFEDKKRARKADMKDEWKKSRARAVRASRNRKAQKKAIRAQAKAEGRA